MKMKFIHTTAYTRDMEKCLDFYTNVMGLEVVGRFHTPDDKEIAFLDAGGGVKIEFIQYANGYAPAVEKTPSWAFEPEDFDAMLKFIEESDEYRVEQGPVEVPGGRFFFFCDFNGIYIQIMEHYDK